MIEAIIIAAEEKLYAVGWLNTPGQPACAARRRVGTLGDILHIVDLYQSADEKVLINQIVYAQITDSSMA